LTIDQVITLEKNMHDFEGFHSRTTSMINH